MKLRVTLTGLLAVLLTVTLTGCLKRVLEVRSDPPGAAVYINGHEVGSTPVDYYFAFYGTLDVVVRHHGYRTEHLQKSLSIPWYQHFPIDFVSEYLVPWPITDRHELAVSLSEYPDLEGDPVVEERRRIAERAAAMRDILRSRDAAPPAP